MPKFTLKEIWQPICFRLFSKLERIGLHLTPVHFYQPIPDTSSLKVSLWQRKSDLVGIDMNDAGQLKLLQDISKFKKEYDKFPNKKTSISHQFFLENGFFEAVDAEILYSIVRLFKPRTIIEVGSGYSTLLSAMAIRKNKNCERDYACKLIAIEPYPNPDLKAGFPELSELLPLQVQDVPLSKFESLNEGDILFIDSSHVLKIGSDVQYLYLEVLPRLKKGVIVHLHDIYLPAEYSVDSVLRKHMFWNEQYLLQAFLLFNDTFQVLWGGSYMNLKHPEILAEAFVSYRRSGSCKGNGSFWMRKVK